MKRPEVPKALRDLHRIRERIHREAVAVGEAEYYSRLNRKSLWLHRRPKPSAALAVREQSTAYGHRPKVSARGR